jgi:hypothetical protein
MSWGGLLEQHRRLRFQSMSVNNYSRFAYDGTAALVNTVLGPPGPNRLYVVNSDIQNLTKQELREPL